MPATRCRAINSRVALSLVMFFPPACAWSTPSSTGSLCHPPEATYFSCGTTRHKLISLCGVPPANLQYRYGSAARMEMQFPDAPEQGVEQLRYAHYDRFRTDRSEVTFRRADADYAVFDYTEDGRRRAGVHVITADGTEHEVGCVGPIRGQLAPLGKYLGCDSDNALNGGQCP